MPCNDPYDEAVIDKPISGRLRKADLGEFLVFQALQLFFFSVQPIAQVVTIFHKQWEPLYLYKSYYLHRIDFKTVEFYSFLRFT